jgi:glycosyltransferase involved in cell wall biosynthesis
MVKKSKVSNKQKKQHRRLEKKRAQNYKPFVSVCTPTFNRRPFIEYAIKCYQHQDYPQDRMEWIIIDDGTDKIGDLVKDISGVKYFEYDEKMTLGKKRNLMHEKSKGEILVYMDDDDYYPPTRVSHAVEVLKKNKNALCAGASEIYIWFKHIQKMYQFGPYNPRHGTAGTFAFKRELLKITKYDDDASLAEEKSFLKNYTIPFVQLNPRHTILVFSHIHNTFDKKTLLDNPNKYIKESDKSVDYFVKEPEMKDFFMEKIDDVLKDYEPGEPKNKPDVIKQTKQITQQRENKKNESLSITLKMPDGKMKTMNMNELNQIYNNSVRENATLKNLVEVLKKQLETERTKLDNLVELNEKNKLLENENKILNMQLKQLTINSNSNIEIEIED